MTGLTKGFRRPRLRPALHGDAPRRTMVAMGLRRRFAAFRDRLGPPRGEPADRAPEDAADDSGEAVRPRLIVGLGNPGPEYRGTRHNVGMWTIQRLAERHGAELARDTRVWRATVEVDGRPLHLAASRSWYNESGPAVASELRRLRLRRTQLLVIYDDIDMAVARVRMRPHGGHGGNNGMRSILDALGGGDFPRVRIGIDRPYDPDPDDPDEEHSRGRPVRDPDRVADWVLSRPPPEERAALDAAIRDVADAIELAAVEGVEAAMNRLNRRE
ncbi:MAG: aminoacyl-tRNA hydrolase [Chloroflexi bacterium]|nr:aminoacyl-tRNA hydrolase [Chloroflexota bacterium]